MAADGSGPVVGTNRRDVDGQWLDLNKRRGGTWPLSERRGPNVTRHCVGISVEIDLAELRMLLGIEPCARRELHDPGHHLVRDSDTHHTGAAVVANKCQVTVDKPTRGRVFRMHCERLSAVDL